MERMAKSPKTIKINAELSPENDISLWALMRILDKPTNPLCPDYDYAQFRTLPVGTLSDKHKTLEIALIYK